MSFDFRLLTFDFCISIYKKRANLQLFFDIRKSLCFFRLFACLPFCFPPVFYFQFLTALTIMILLFIIIMFIMLLLCSLYNRSITSI